MDKVWRRQRVWRVTAFLACLAGLWGQGPPATLGQIEIGGRTYPNLGYYSAFNLLREGEIDDALRAFQSHARGGLRIAQGRWIDSICHHAMVGECLYRLGDLSGALDQYNTALKIFLMQPDWMLRVDFPASVGPAQRGVRIPIAWATSSRRSVPGEFPDSYQILFGNLNNEDAIRRGGVVVPPEFYSVNVPEIVRCTALALRRRNELLGPVCEYDPLTARLLAAFEGRVAPVNHWSQAWINLQHGLALIGAGKRAEAAVQLRTAVVIGGQYDHPLTATALLEMGKLALADNGAQTAGNYFLDATLTAAYFEQVEIMEEAFRLATEAFLIHGQAKGLFPPLEPAAAWAQRQGLRHLYAALTVLAAENLATVRQPAQAGKMLAAARARLGRRAGMAAPLAARFDYVSALVNYQLGKSVAANDAFVSAVQRQRRVSPWLFQIGVTNTLFGAKSGPLTSRAADLLYEQLLREPDAPDWHQDPLDTIAVVMTPQPIAYENWFEVALERDEIEKALEIADRIRRHRFFSGMAMGGRLLALRWVLEADQVLLDQAALARRVDLLARYPEYKQLSDQAAELRQQVGALPYHVEDQDEWQSRFELLQQLDALATRQEILLGEIALRRESCPFVFPPLRKTSEVQQVLAENQLALVFFTTRRAMYAFMLGQEKYSAWRVQSPARVKRAVAQLLAATAMGSDNNPVSVKQLADSNWPQPATELLKELIDRAQWGFWERFEELVIVPDRFLWYVPFEALPIGDQEDQPEPLIARMRVRYVPTMGLIGYDRRTSRRNPRTAVIVGKLFPRAEVEVAQEQLASMQQVIQDLEPISGKPTGPTGLQRVLWDRLLVLDDIPEVREDPLAWSPGRLDMGRPGGILSRWLALPWGGPLQILLPGFHTAAESGLKKSATGDEVFLATTSLMASGARTLLLSRWRPGGQTSYDLIREFMQEESRTSAAAAWQRSVNVLRASEVDPAFEPRIGRSDQEAILKAEHPFFWAGYLLIDAGRSTPAGNGE